MNTQQPDRLYATPHTQLEAFRFDAAVAAVFDDMIRRSVPGYGLMLDMIVVAAQQYAQAGTQLYDLGCSLGASTLALRRGAPADCRITAIDNAPAMLERAQGLINTQTDGAPVTLRCENLLDTVFEGPVSLAVCNLTLQFLPPPQRLPLLQRLAASMPAGAALLLSEKIALNDGEQETLLMELHHGFKRAQGYSDLEIAQKRNALETVLLPETLEAHTKRLHAAGFRQVLPWFQCCNFVSLLALR